MRLLLLVTAALSRVSPCSTTSTAFIVPSVRTNLFPATLHSPAHNRRHDFTLLSCTPEETCGPNSKSQFNQTPQEHLPHLLRRSDLINSAKFLIASAILSGQPIIANAAERAMADRPPLDKCLYTILRAKEAMGQETRLIRSGKFRDVQRANVKLAISFIVKNYRLADTFNAASTYLQPDGGEKGGGGGSVMMFGSTDGGSSDKAFQAADVGRTVVEALYTITEYFDASDVQNLKVGSYDSMAGKEGLVLQGLESARKGVDTFLSYFPSEEVSAAQRVIDEENELNLREWDPKLGVILNPDPNKGDQPVDDAKSSSS